MTRGLEFKLLVFAILVAVAASSFFYASFSLNHDSSWYLVATRMFLDGGTLYRDIIEINPPLAFYLTVPALVISDLTGLRPATAYFLYVATLGGISTLWVYALCRRAAWEVMPRLLMTGCAFVACFLIAMGDFGQREHLMLIFALPYSTYLVFREDLSKIGWFEQSALGLFAFFGLGLKPYFLLIPAGLIGFRFFYRQSVSEIFNIANMTLGFMLVLYLGLISTWHPLYFEAIIPEASLVYSAFKADTVAVLVKAEVFGVLAAIALAFACRRDLDLPAIAIVGGLVGATLSYMIQFKGWDYQVIPVAFFAFLTASWITYLSRRRIREHVVLGVLSLLAIMFTLGVQIAGGPYTSRTTKSFGEFVHREQTPVLVLSSNVSAAFPFVNETNAIWTSRYPTQWLLPGAVSLLESTDCVQERPVCDEYRSLIAVTRSRMIEDFSRGRPSLVYVDDREKKSYFGETRFDYLEFLLADPSFTELWRDYHLLGRVGNYEVWGFASAVDDPESPASIGSVS